LPKDEYSNCLLDTQHGEEPTGKPVDKWSAQEVRRRINSSTLAKYARNIATVSNEVFYFLKSLKKQGSVYFAVD
jgi:hypothetical protein